jgi:hypothetical protein
MNFAGEPYFFRQLDECFESHDSELDIEMYYIDEYPSVFVAENCRGH